MYQKYICANEMWIVSVLSFKYRGIIYGCINAPGHVRSRIDGINESSKTHTKQKMCMIGTE